MFRTLSYLNLIFAVLYFLGYLQNSSAFVISGLFGAVAFNWMALRSLEKEEFKWTIFHWVASLMTLFFAVFIGCTAINVLLDAIEYKYYPTASITLISISLLFTLALLFHLCLSLIKSIEKKSDQLFDN